MKRLLWLVLQRIRRQFLDWSSAWWFTLTLVANEAVSPLIGLFVWTAALPRDPRLASYFVALVAVQMMTASYENHTFSESIYEGTIAHELLKPQPIAVGPIGENIAIRIWMTLFGLPLVALAGFAAGVSYRLTYLLLAVPALLLAAILRFLWTWLLALAALWTERVHAVTTFGIVLTVLFGGSAVPLALLAQPWRSIVQALPFRAMLGLPAEIATGTTLGPGAVAGVAWQLAWIAVFAALGVVVWRAGLRRYTVVGA